MRLAGYSLEDVCRKMRLAGYSLEDVCRTTMTPNERPMLERVDDRNDIYWLEADFRYGSWLCENAKTRSVIEEVIRSKRKRIQLKDQTEKYHTSSRFDFCVFEPAQTCRHPPR